ncbi:MAG: ComF family protein [Sneathiella sp.]
MRSNIKKVCGNWDLGFVLDKHLISSKFIGHSESGHPQFDNKRTEIGQALYQLKYQGDWSQVQPLAQELSKIIYPKFRNVGLIIPMPATNNRQKQPVAEIAKALGEIVDCSVCDNILLGNAGGPQLKNLDKKEDKAKALEGKFYIQDGVYGDRVWSALLVDDLFATGATMEAACNALRSYRKIGKIYIAALTWK